MTSSARRSGVRVIRASDLHIERKLASGGYGDVHLAPDLSTEALIDCGRIGPGGSLGGRLGRILDRWSRATGGVRGWRNRFGARGFGYDNI